MGPVDGVLSQRIPNVPDLVHILPHLLILSAILISAGDPQQRAHQAGKPTQRKTMRSIEEDGLHSHDLAGQQETGDEAAKPGVTTVGRIIGIDDHLMITVALQVHTTEVQIREVQF